ncbi:MAG TPA: hypothetical protein VFU06_08255 [Longimicrobiales bacterium]|nr:hypothetical protein [Longimicrobiales bacterium]
MQFPRDDSAAGCGDEASVATKQLQQKARAFGADIEVREEHAQQANPPRTSAKNLSASAVKKSSVPSVSSVVDKN